MDQVRKKAPSVTEGEKKEEFRLLDGMVLLYLLLFAVQYVLRYYMSEGLFRVFMYAVAGSFPFLGLWYCKGRLVIKNVYEGIYLFIYFFVLCNTLLHVSSPEASGHIETILIYLPMLSAFFFRDLTTRDWDRIFFFTGALAVVLFLWVLSRTPIDFSVAINRGYQWSEIFYFASPFCFSFQFLILSFLRKKHLVFSMVVLAADIVLNLIVVKRMILLQLASLAAVLLLILLFNRKGGNMRQTLVLIALAAVVIVFVSSYLGELFDSIFERALAESEELDEFSRFEESQNYLSEAGILDILLGKGFNATHTGLGKTATALHVGWINFILKGGILLFSLAAIPCLKAIVSLFRFSKLTEKEKFSVCILLYTVPNLFMGNLHGFTPNLFLFFWCAIQVMCIQNQKEGKLYRWRKQ